MTDPNHTDTSRSGDLVETLLCVGRGGVLHFRRPKQTHPVCAEAADRIETLEAENERLREALRWMVDNDETNEGDEPMKEFGGQSWNEINAYWVEGLNRARAALGVDTV